VTSSAALRRVSSITLAVAFVAMATSGLLMLLVDRFGFQIRMHPVHNVFGIIMIIAGVLHAVVNWRPLAAHLRPRWSMMLGVLLLGVMALLLLDGLTRPLDAAAIQKIEDTLTAARRQSTPTN
jgi:Domain of unknown function (DUF4405)